MEKSWSDLTVRLAAILDFGPYGGWPHRNFSGEPIFQSFQYSEPFKTKMAAVWVVVQINDTQVPVYNGIVNT